MQTVSQEWKDIQEKQLVDESFLEISFAIGDPDALEDATAKDNGAVYLSNTKQSVSPVDKHIVPYATLEQNMWLLDGSRKFIPASDYGDTGYIGDMLSEADGTFAVTPVVDINFAAVHIPVIPGITITWGQVYGEYAEAFKVTAYNGTTVVAEKSITDNASVMSVVDMDIADYNRIQIEILKWCLPFHRARIADVFSGITKVYTKTDVTKFEHEQNVDPIGGTTPISKVSFSLDNSDNKYDPYNVTGLSKYLMERQEIKVKYGFQLGDRSTEDIPAGVFYLSEWNAPQNGLEASFTARDILEFMSKTYIKGKYAPDGASLHSLAVNVLEDAKLPLNDDGTVKWLIDDGLKTILTAAPLPLAPIAECLQYIAQAAGCALYCDRKGVLHIGPITTDKTDYVLSEFNLFSRPEISLQKPLMRVDVKVYNYFVEASGKEVFKGKVVVNGTETVTITYSGAAINTVATVTGGTLGSAVYYSNACVLTITGTGELTVVVKGDLLKTSDSDYALAVGDVGEVQSVANPLVTSTAIASDVATWVKGWLANRRKMNIEGWRADPRLDAGDILTSENKYGTERIRMTSVKYSYQGSFRGSGEGRSIT